MKHKSYMAYTTYILFLLLYCSTAQATDLPCYSKSVHFQTVPHEKESVITLEAGRVKSVTGKTFTYNLGKEDIIIISDSFAMDRFIKDVKAGRCSAREKVTLVPERKSPFNTKFKAH